MHPSDLIPRPEAIPGPWGLYEVLLLGVFVVHLLLMNIVLGGTVIAAVESLGGKAPGLRAFAAKIPPILALAVNFGVAPLLFVQVLYGRFIYVSSILMAVHWLSAVGLVILAYYGMYLFSLRHDGLGRGRTLVAGASALLLLLVAFVFVNNMSLMLRPEAWAAYFGRPDGTLLNLSDPTLAPRYLHFVLAALAVGGLFRAVVAAGRGKKGLDSPADAEAGVRRGMRWFSLATLAQLGVGAWFLVSLPREVMLLFMGRSPLPTAALVVGLAGAGLALAFGLTRRVRLAAWTTGATVAVMAVLRSELRAALLGPYLPAEGPEVVFQRLPLLIFLAALAGVLLSIGAMVLWLRRLPPPASMPLEPVVEPSGPAGLKEQEA